MLDRIYLDNNETHNYPFYNTNTTYPKGLISDISILVPPEIESVSVYSIIVTDYRVSVIFTGIVGGSAISLGHSEWNKTGLAVSNIIQQDTGDSIGWVSFGSRVDTEGMYVGNEQIMSNCIYKNTNSSAKCVFNGVSYDTPEVLNINILGDLDYVDDKITVIVDNYPGLLDKDDPEQNGGITSINGISLSGKDTLVITLPGITDYPGRGSLFAVSVKHKDITRNDPRRFTVVTISNAFDTSDKAYESFTCPDTDPLLDTILVNKHEVAYHDTPLDIFIEWYKNNRYELKAVTDA